jgi:hypothetical protein
MGRAERLTNYGGVPWAGPDVERQRVASANWSRAHPALCYEFGDPHGDAFIPEDVIARVVHQPQIVVVTWQPEEITVVNVQHTVARTFTPAADVVARPKRDWCDVTLYAHHADRPPVYKTHFADLDPRDVMPSLVHVLRTPLGYPLPPEQKLLRGVEGVGRILIEFPRAAEHEPWPLDTSISVLGALASREYLHTIWADPKV